jgi:hypothetical protein
MSKVPFEGRIFWKVLPTVYILVVIAWVLFVRFGGYEMTPADYGGSFLSATIFAYLIHLWILPGDYSHYDEEDPSEYHEPAENLSGESATGEKHADEA